MRILDQPIDILDAPQCILTSDRLTTYSGRFPINNVQMDSHSTAVSFNCVSNRQYDDTDDNHTWSVRAKHSHHSSSYDTATSSWNPCRENGLMQGQL